MFVSFTTTHNRAGYQPWSARNMGGHLAKNSVSTVNLPDAKIEVPGFWTNCPKLKKCARQTHLLLFLTTLHWELFSPNSMILTDLPSLSLRCSRVAGARNSQSDIHAPTEQTWMAPPLLVSSVSPEAILILERFLMRTLNRSFCCYINLFERTFFTVTLDGKQRME